MHPLCTIDRADEVAYPRGVVDGVGFGAVAIYSPW